MQGSVAIEPIQFCILLIFTDPINTLLVIFTFHKVRQPRVSQKMANEGPSVCAHKTESSEDNGSEQETLHSLLVQ
jgi:hypothetical protein